MKKAVVEVVVLAHGVAHQLPVTPHILHVLTSLYHSQMMDLHLPNLLYVPRYIGESPGNVQVAKAQL